MNKLTIQFILEQIKVYKKEIIIGFVFLLFTNLLGATLPLYIKRIIEYISQDNYLVSQVLKLLFIALALALGTMLTRILSRVFIFGVGRQVESRQKQLFFEHLLSLDYLYFNTKRIGDLISRSSNDMQLIRQMMGFGLLNIINIIWSYIFVVPILWNLNYKLTIIVLLGYIPILYLAKLLSNKLKVLQQENQEKLAYFTSFLEEDLNGIHTIKAYNQSAREIKRFDLLNKDYLQTASYLARVRSLVWPILSSTRIVNYFVLILFATLGQLEVASIIAILMYLERLVFPISIMGWLITIFQRGSISVARLSEVFNEISHHTGSSSQKLSNNQDITNYNITVKNLSYSYSQELSNYSNQLAQDNKNILENISLDIPEGKIVVIKGAIGSGKSTLAMCLANILKVSPETIYLGNQDITLLSTSVLRDYIQLVPQSNFVFNSSVYNNLTVFDERVTLDEIKRICKLCCIDQEIEDLKDNYYTVIGEKGVDLSGGQIQRLMIARALLKNPKVLIFDQSFSSLDNETTYTIMNNLKKYYSEVTLIFITYKESLLAEAQEIIEI